MDSIYLDNNATTPMAPEAAEAMAPWLAAVPANPSASHRFGQRARAEVERARDRVAALFGDDAEVVFTSGGTEADNQVIHGACGTSGGAHLVTSPIEHPAVLEPAATLAGRGLEVDFLRVDPEGRVDPESLAGLLRPETRLVSVMAANNELGTLQPMSRIVATSHAAGVPVLCDAVQVVSWYDDSATGGADFLSLSAHKIGGPTGIGALLIRNGRDLPGWVRGGGQQKGRRGGTEPTALIAGFGAACERVGRERASQSARIGRLSERLVDGLRERVPDLRVTVERAPRLPNTVHVCVPGVDATTLVARLDLDGVAASAGSACASGVAHGSPVLEAIGLPAELRGSALRLSLGYQTTDAEIARALEIVPAAVAGVRSAVGSG